ncbi:phage/plasmid replication protein, II/X family [Methylomonas sp. MS20]|uniref:phage/plasmid replication protein, II/X family n=1 Tax=unclassified Methylomonas TaxID=2608980 RepID=UPI0028A2E188|nr:phage/plasmid replication protein, II/X family [Methylomonas sp. MV1]MDT4328323.1 phage/plasmid replication protein, II/X family [Methylomonas sp. MV1]
MLIDWITAYLPLDKIPVEHWQDLRQLTDRVLRYCPKTGEARWESSAWDSIRSDSHQIAFRVGSDAVWLQGSPARVCGSGDAVFGEGPAAALDLVGCLHRMRSFVSAQIGIELSTDADHWTVTRIDVTGNLLLDDLAAVRVALRTLRECEGGRYRVSQQAGDTVYWSHKSRLRAGKAYAKGPHIDYQTKKLDYSGRHYSPTEKELTNRLLRLELRLGAQWLRERTGQPWTALKPQDLTKEWREYFNRMIGAADMINDDDLKTRIISSADSEGKGKAAYMCFLFIKQNGWQSAKENYPRTTFYRHMEVLRKAGLGDADISTGNVVPLRRKVIECQMISSWTELRQYA